MTVDNIHYLGGRVKSRPTFSTILGYVGACLLAISPFFIAHPIGKIGCITGALLMLPQFYQGKLWNGVALNIVATLGYIWSLTL